MNFVRALGVSFILIGALPASADQVVEQIDLAKHYYEQGDLAGAIDELEFAIGTLRRQTLKLYMDTLPGPPAGWAADPPKVESSDEMFGAGATIMRHYRQQNGSGSIRFEIVVVDSRILQGFAALLTNPAILGSDPEYERIRIGRENAFLKWQEKNGRGEIKFILGGKIVTELEGRNLAHKDTLIDLIRRWDVKKVKSIAGL